MAVTIRENASSESTLFSPPALTAPIQYSRRRFSADEVSTPAYFWENAVAVQPVNSAPTIELVKKPAGCVHFEQRVRGTFSGSFELSQFPYDVQNLCITLRITSSQDTKLNRRFVFNKGKGVLGKEGGGDLSLWNSWMLL